MLNQMSENQKGATRWLEKEAFGAVAVAAPHCNNVVG
jgi:hypothetical protein